MPVGAQRTPGSPDPRPRLTLGSRRAEEGERRCRFVMIGLEAGEGRGLWGLWWPLCSLKHFSFLGINCSQSTEEGGLESGP